MKVLKQKYHGLPGIGINGRAGQVGKNGKSVYFGYINDFFDGEPISIAPYVYIAKRLINGNSSDSENSSIALDVAIEEFKANYHDEDFNYKKFLEDTSNHYINYQTFYYTGNRIGEKPDMYDGILTDNTATNAKNIKLDINGDYLNMSYILYTLNTSDDYDEIKLYKTELDNVLAHDLLNSEDPLSTMYVNILPNQGSKYIFNSSASLFIGSLVFSYDTNDAIYNKESSAGNAAETGQLLLNSSYSNYYQYVPSDTSTYYVLENIMPNDVTSLYVLDADNLYGHLNLSTISGYNSEYELKFKNDGKYIANGDASLWNLVYKTSFSRNKADSLYEEGDLLDFNDKANYGIAPSALYLDRGTSTVSLNPDANFFDPNYKLNLINNGTHDYAEALLTSANGAHIYYSLNSEDSEIFVPTTLKSIYNVGDVLFFYVNKSDYSTFDKYEITYMAVITEKLINCSPEELIKNAVLYTPLTLKSFIENGKRLLSYNPVATVLNSILTSESIDVYKRKLSNNAIVSINDNYTNSPVLLNSSSNNYNTITALSNKKKVLTGNNSSNGFEITADKAKIKIKNLLYNTNNITENTNVELHNIYNQNIKYDDNHFVKPLEDIDLYIDNLGELYGVFMYTINANEYFYDIQNIDNYIYGCDVYNKDMQKINTFTSSDSELKIQIIPDIDNDTYYIQMFASCNNSIKYISRLSKLTVTYEKILYNKTTLTNTKTYSKSIGKYNRPIGLFKKDLYITKPATTYIERYKISKFVIEVLGTDLQILREKKSGNITFDLSDISAEKVTKASLNIYAEDSSIIIDEILFNGGICIDSIVDSIDDIILRATVKDDSRYPQDLPFSNDYYKYVGETTYNNNKCYLWVPYEFDMPAPQENEYIELYLITNSKHLSLPFSINSPEFVARLDYQDNDSTYKNHLRPTMENNDSIRLIEYYKNGELVGSEQLLNNSKIQKTGIANLTTPYWIDIKENSSTSYTLNLDSNLPKNIYSTGTSTINSLAEYVVLGNLNDSADHECPLFKYLHTNEEAQNNQYTKLRSVLVTAKYHYIDRPNEYYYENFNIVQPGFKDTRGVPNIKLNMHTDILELESYNSIENGVLANQFVTYLDIDIEDFKKQWGQFSDVADIKLDLELFNIPYDLEWQQKYLVKDGTNRCTFRTIPELENSAKLLNNYVRIQAGIVETDKNLLTLNNSSSFKTGEGSLNSIKGGEYLIVESFKYFNNNGDTSLSPTIMDSNSNRILCDSSFMTNSLSNRNIEDGLQYDSSISLSNIPLNDNINSIKLRLLFEFGNPILANAYLRYAVNNVTVHVNTYDDRHAVFRTFVPTDTTSQDNTYLYNVVDENEGAKTIKHINYKFISDPLDVTFNPLSYTVCPDDAESSYTNIYGDIYKYGIKEQILKELKFFNSSVYTEDSIYVLRIPNSDIRNDKLFVYDNLNIKKSYIQDNIKSINVKPLSLYDIIDKVNLEDSANQISEIVKTHNVHDSIEGNKYMQIIYNASLMNPRVRKENEYTFFYNDVELKRSKYNLAYTETPIYGYDEHSMELRDDELINSMDLWNDYYTQNKSENGNSVYKGILSMYGNGYTLILQNDVLIKGAQDLDIVKELNSDIINLNLEISEVSIKPSNLNIEPSENLYYRGFLYDIGWKFPYYDKISIVPYTLVSPFDNISLNPSIFDSLGTKYLNYLNSLKNYTNNCYIPYTLLYNIYPRIAYNYDVNKVNVFMLRKPSIQTDTDIIETESEFNQKFVFNRRLFNLL